MTASVSAVGVHLRDWRQRRRMSQLDLACEAEISTRHLSFMETGRAQPSRDMVLRLAERLDVPLRERNVILVAAGFAPVYPQRPLDDPGLAGARRAVDLILTGHEPYPALAVDRGWNLVTANRMVAPLMASADASLRAAPVNVMRLTLHPLGLAPRIANLAQWRAHLLERVRRDLEATGDRGLAELMAELRSYPTPDGGRTRPPANEFAGVAVPFQIATTTGLLSFYSTTTVFGTPVDVTLSELTLETFFPADEATAAAGKALAAALSGAAGPLPPA
jgi:transcriptional regulator with XRE-family HTH domain